MVEPGTYTIMVHVDADTPSEVHDAVECLWHFVPANIQHTTLPPREQCIGYADIRAYFNQVEPTRQRAQRSAYRVGNYIKMNYAALEVWDAYCQCRLGMCECPNFSWRIGLRRSQSYDLTSRQYRDRWLASIESLLAIPLEQVRPNSHNDKTPADLASYINHLRAQSVA